MPYPTLASEVSAKPYRHAAQADVERPYVTDRIPFRHPSLPRRFVRARSTRRPSELEGRVPVIAEDDEAGQEWCEEHDFPGLHQLCVV